MSKHRVLPHKAKLYIQMIVTANTITHPSHFPTGCSAVGCTAYFMYLGNLLTRRMRIRGQEKKRLGAVVDPASYYSSPNPSGQ